ncbi:leucine-rich repeat protein [Weeksellaceae bacterium TAE3-ERU29]|nr:leucine-rich repeat protein [Weeksellaceae bacterium TAE3-ERU29]
MKSKYLILSVLFITLGFTACQDNEDMPAEKIEKKENPTSEEKGMFATNDGSFKPLSEDGNTALKTLLPKVDINRLNTREPLVITENQYKEIADYTAKEIVKDAKGMEAFKRIFNWITKNVKHTPSDNNPYAVFKNKKAICYGFSNLTKTMMLSQGLPCMVVTGYLYGTLAHSWNYAFVDGKWIVIDTTNGGWFFMDEIQKYKHLHSHITDISLFEDENFVYNYEDGLNITKIKINKEILSIPYGTSGYIINVFNPRSEIPKDVKQLYISDNITYTGENSFGLSKMDKSLEEIYVKNTNKKFESYKNVLYLKGKDIPEHIPAMMKKLELKPIKTVGKNTVYNHSNLEEIIFSGGTLKIEAYAVENCPKVSKITIPKNTELDDRAFVNVGKDLQIIKK